MKDRAESLIAKDSPEVYEQEYKQQKHEAGKYGTDVFQGGGLHEWLHFHPVYIHCCKVHFSYSHSCGKFYMFYG